jgi:outer membrane protein OmpA-like peptidoglycan-associated protein
MKNTSRLLVRAVLLASFAVACGSTLPPKELVDARAAYQTAAKGPAGQQSPAELHVAKQALDQAERAFNDDGDAPPTKDFAYIAIRKSQLAEASARAALAQKEREAAERATNDERDNQLKSSRSEAERIRAEADRAKADLSKTQDQLAVEKRAREEAEKKAAQALADLQKIASVKQESRGTVITLSGEVLFASGESTLRPAAILKLNDVATALTTGNPESTITVEGHTDAQGQRAFNMDLAQKRANAVREQLVARGVAADRIKAVGVGPDKPVASNDNAEGRANNRRVEIVVQNK